MGRNYSAQRRVWQLGEFVLTDNGACGGAEGSWCRTVELLGQHESPMGDHFRPSLSCNHQHDKRSCGVEYYNDDRHGIEREFGGRDRAKLEHKQRAGNRSEYDRNWNGSSLHSTKWNELEFNISFR